jgi:hypothetical protein
MKTILAFLALVLIITSFNPFSTIKKSIQRVHEKIEEI